MQVYKKVVAHAANSKIHREPAGGFYMITQVPLHKDRRTGVTVMEQQKIRRLGISKALAAEFWPEYVPVYATSHKKLDGKTRQFAAVTGSVYTSRTLDAKEAKKLRKERARKSGKSKHARMINGMRLGTKVHNELHMFTSISNMAENGLKNSASACRSVENALSKNGKSGSIQPCTHAILQSMRDKWKWYPAAAEWCVGDFSPNGVYATQIDMIALELPTIPKEERTNRVILCEVKTGYNGGMFFRANAPMRHVAPVMNNSPQNQAKMQLVMGAAMFCSMYGVSWNSIDMYVIWCPSEGAVLTPERLYVKPEERDAFLRALKKRGFL